MYSFSSRELGNFRPRYVQTSSEDHATYSLTPDPSFTEHCAYRLYHYHMSRSHEPITTKPPIIPSQRGRASEVMQDAKAQKNKQPPILQELCSVEVESKIGNKSCQERTAVTVKTKSLQASSNHRCSIDCAIQDVPV